MSELDQAIRRYAASPVPRYTSYPTAAEFGGDVDASDYGDWLRAIDASAPVSAYIHIPYCRDLCFYCGCHAKALRRDDVLQTYMRALVREIETVSSHLKAQVRIGNLHWGGGTPGILGEEGLETVLHALRRSFAIDANVSHAIELDPRHVTASFAKALKRLGVNRASLGVQDVDATVQAAIGRIQPIETVRAAVDHLRAAGIGSINFDLIYGLPRQSSLSLKETCRAVAALMPDRIACYGYAHMPSRRANQKRIDGAMLPSASERIEQAATAAEELRALGFQPVGIDHFARQDDPLAMAAAEGRLRRNFQGYTDDDSRTLLGFGCSAISRLPDGYVQNETDAPRYGTTAAAGDLATVRGCRMTGDDWTRARIIEALMCNFRVDLAAMGIADQFQDELALLRPMVNEGVLTISNGVIAMTASGRTVVRVAASMFDAHRWTTHGQFSAAV